MSQYPSQGFQYGEQEGRSEPPAYGEGSYNSYPPESYQQQTYGDVQSSYNSTYAAPQSYLPEPIYGGDNGSNVYQPMQSPPQTIAQPDHQGDEEKGLAGALAGGVAGAYAGHKVDHGFLGAVGGAWAGSKLEDTYKESHQEPEKKEKHHHHHFFHRRHSSSSSSSSSSKQDDQPASRPSNLLGAEPGHPGQHGNFSHTSTNISLNPKTLILEARCANVRGEYQTSQLNLNSVIANVNGNFRWIFAGPPGDLAWSVHDIRAQYEDANREWPAGWYLRGRIKNNEGGLADADSLLLDKNIENVDGRLVFCRYDTTHGIHLG